MNILITANYSAPKSGNFVASLVALARNVREEGSNIYFVFPNKTDWIDWFNEEGFTTIIYDYESFPLDEQFVKLKEIINKYDIDIIHTHFGMFRQTILKNRKKIKEVKILIHDHMGYYVDHNILVQKMGYAALSIVYTFKRIRVAAVFKSKKNAYVFLPQKWYIPNGLSLERHLPVSMTREDCRKKLGLSESDKVCLLLGWDLKRKGLDIALKAIKKCRETDKNIIIGIIGAGEEAPSDFAREFILKECSINPNEIWIKYFKNQEDMFAVHRAVDAYLATSRQEGFPYGVLEAISQNSPIVASDIKAQRWAKEYTNSYFYQTEDFNKCAEAIACAIKTGRQKSNYEYFIDKYSINNWCKSIIDIYHRL